MLQCQMLELALVSDTDGEQCTGTWTCVPMSCEGSSLPGSSWGWRMGS